MRYLRKFNESADGGFSDFKKFCEDSLAYLIDDGFRVKVDAEDNTLSILIHKFSFPNWTNFTWDDVKDDVIPLLELLKEKYYFNENISFIGEDLNYNNFYLSYKYDNILNDNFPLEKDVDYHRKDNKIIKIEIIKKFK
jgi:hypothetical protein